MIGFVVRSRSKTLSRFLGQVRHCSSAICSIETDCPNSLKSCIATSGVITEGDCASELSDGPSFGLLGGRF